MRDLDCERIQVDEIWSYVGKKQRHLTSKDDPYRVGDIWTFVAIDADNKLIIPRDTGHRVKDHIMIMIQNEVLDEKTTENPQSGIQARSGRVLTS
jgi:hypothetical protein